MLRQKLLSFLVAVSVLGGTFALPSPAYAGAPYPPELLSPSDNATVSQNPPTLCARATDPDGDPVRIRFEAWGGGEGDHDSPWIQTDSEGKACWTDSGAWTYETHTWQARAIDSNNEQSGASPTRKINFQAPSTPEPTCTIEPMYTDPPAPSTVGTVVKVHAEASCTNGVSEIRFLVDGNLIGKVSGSSGTVNWDTSSYVASDHTVKAEAYDSSAGLLKTRTETYLLEPANAPTPTPPPKGPSITTLDFSPNSATVGTDVSVHVKVDSTNPGAIKVTVPCGESHPHETTTPEFTSTWVTNTCGAGNYTVKVCARHVNDPNWSNMTCRSESYSLSSQSDSVDAPTAKIWSDAQDIAKGQCTTLRWETSNASKVELDGSSVSTTGTKQVCPYVTTLYSLKAIGDGGEATSNVSVGVYTAPTSTPEPTENETTDVASHFSTGELIKIGYDVYVIVSGQRRQVPNPDTLDALGVSQNQVNNKGFSDNELREIPKGSDIPDVNRDHDGFMAFKNQVFPNTTPIVPGATSTSGPNQVQPTATLQGEVSSQSSGQEIPEDAIPLCTTEVVRKEDGNIITWFLDLISGEVKAARGPFPYETECVAYVSTRRPDSLDWLNYGAFAHVWDDMARSNGAEFGVYVDKNPRPGDVAVWEAGCNGRHPVHGHVAFVVAVSPDGKAVTVDERNPYGKGEIYLGQTYDVVDCMSFIHKPGGNPPGNQVDQSTNSSDSTAESASSQQSVIDKIIDWFKTKFGQVFK